MSDLVFIGIEAGRTQGVADAFEALDKAEPKGPNIGLAMWLVRGWVVALRAAPAGPVRLALAREGSGAALEALDALAACDLGVELAEGRMWARICALWFRQALAQPAGRAAQPTAAAPQRATVDPRDRVVFGLVPAGRETLARLVTFHPLPWDVSGKRLVDAAGRPVLVVGDGDPSARLLLLEMLAAAVEAATGSSEGGGE